MLFLLRRKITSFIDTLFISTPPDASNTAFQPGLEARKSTPLDRLSIDMRDQPTKSSVQPATKSCKKNNTIIQSTSCLDAGPTPNDTSRPKRNRAPVNYTLPVFIPDNPEEDEDWRPNTGTTSSSRSKEQTGRPTERGVMCISSPSTFTNSQASSGPMTPPADTEEMGSLIDMSGPPADAVEISAVADMRGRKRRRTEDPENMNIYAKRQEVATEDVTSRHPQTYSPDGGDIQVMKEHFGSFVDNFIDVIGHARSHVPRIEALEIQHSKFAHDKTQLQEKVDDIDKDLEKYKQHWRKQLPKMEDLEARYIEVETSHALLKTIVEGVQKSVGRYGKNLKVVDGLSKRMSECEESLKQEEEFQLTCNDTLTRQSNLLHDLERTIVKKPALDRVHAQFQALDKAIKSYQTQLSSLEKRLSTKATTVEVQTLVEADLKKRLDDEFVQVGKRFDSTEKRLTAEIQTSLEPLRNEIRLLNEGRACSVTVKCVIDDVAKVERDIKSLQSHLESLRKIVDRVDVDVPTGKFALICQQVDSLRSTKTADPRLSDISNKIFDLSTKLAEVAKLRTEVNAQKGRLHQLGNTITISAKDYKSMMNNNAGMKHCVENNKNECERRFDDFTDTVYAKLSALESSFEEKIKKNEEEFGRRLDQMSASMEARISAIDSAPGKESSNTKNEHNQTLEPTKGRVDCECNALRTELDRQCTIAKTLDNRLQELECNLPKKIDEQMQGRLGDFVHRDNFNKTKEDATHLRTSIENLIQLNTTLQTTVNTCVSSLDTKVEGFESFKVGLQKSLANASKMLEKESAARCTKAIKTAETSAKADVEALKQDLQTQLNMIEDRVDDIQHLTGRPGAYQEQSPATESGEFVPVPDGEINQVVGALRYQFTTECMKLSDMEMDTRNLRRNFESLKNDVPRQTSQQLSTVTLRLETKISDIEIAVKQQLQELKEDLTMSAVNSQKASEKRCDDKNAATLAAIMRSNPKPIETIQGGQFRLGNSIPPQQPPSACNSNNSIVCVQNSGQVFPSPMGPPLIGTPMLPSNQNTRRVQTAPGMNPTSPQLTPQQQLQFAQHLHQIQQRQQNHQNRRLSVPVTTGAQLQQHPYPFLVQSQQQMEQNGYIFFQSPSGQTHPNTAPYQP